jgi:2-polyprenyl-3-methyl-5-hydroxy-6-metoxy-1,4-benzoquinol methylase
MHQQNATCHMCGTSGLFDIHTIKDRMFEGGQEYDYLRCPDCGSLQIAQMLTAEELAAHYHDTYYSFHQNAALSLKQKLQVMRDQATLGTGSLMARVVGSVIRLFQKDPQLETLREIGIRPGDRILDVGCGAGRIIDRLARAGFTEVTGVDPFLPHDMRTPAGVPLFQSAIEDIEGEYDVIMFNHSFEHVTAPGETIRSTLRNLARGGKCVLRVPTVSSEAWDKYRENWVQLDAPRHTVIPSRQGMRRLALRFGARLVNEIDDATAFQFIGSELYELDLSLFPDPAAPSRATTPKEYFSLKQLSKWRQRTRELNQNSRGDQAAFVLQKARI